MTKGEAAFQIIQLRIGDSDRVVESDGHAQIGDVRVVIREDGSVYLEQGGPLVTGHFAADVSIDYPMARRLAFEANMAQSFRSALQVLARYAFRRATLGIGDPEAEEALTVAAGVIKQTI